MKQELVRINSIDGIQLPGILYTPESNSKRIVIHIHGLNGNFYENNFLDEISKSYTNRGYAFLTFNNRGRGFISEFWRGTECVVIGSSLEKFKECILDIEGVLNYAKENGYEEIVLEGHSYGCNKVLYYYNQKKDKNVKKIVLLAPCDIPAELKKFLSKEEYEKAENEAIRLVNKGKEDELIDFSVLANGKIAAGTYYNDFLPGGEDDFIRYREGKNAKSDVLENIDIPTLIVFGDNDECVLTVPIQDVKDYLKNNLKDCNIQIIKGTDHEYTDKYKELGKIIEENI